MGCPFGARVSGNVDLQDLPVAVTQDDEAVQDTEGHHWLMQAKPSRSWYYPPAVRSPSVLSHRSGMPSGRTLQFDVLRIRFLNWTFIGGPGCIWRAMMPLEAAKVGCRSVTWLIKTPLT